MSSIVILGGGTAGTIVANRLRKESPAGTQITVVDSSPQHHYQPGYLFTPFTGKPERYAKARAPFFAEGIKYREATIAAIHPESSTVSLAGGESLPYDVLIIATGARIRPDLTEGMEEGALWRSQVFDFYTMEGATALHSALESFEGGTLAVHITDMPIKCPVAPIEFTLLADDYLRKRRIRHLCDIIYITPLDSPFTKPIASRELSSLLADRSIFVETDFATESIDNEARELVSYDGRRIGFDLLVTVPLHTGQAFLDGSELADESAFVTVDKHTLQSTAYPNVFAMGDAANLPTSKAGAVAHFSAPVLVENVLAYLSGGEATARFDGHANCFIETGRGQAMLLDFNYETEPLTGHYPTPAGPMRLLGNSRINHLGKLAFEQLYWKVLLPGHDMPVPDAMSMWGKKEEH